MTAGLLRSPALQQIALRLETTIPHVSAVTISDSAGAILADSQKGRIGQAILGPDVSRLLADGGESAALVESEGQHWIRITSAISGPYDAARQSNLLGLVQLDLRTDFAQGRVQRTFLGSLMLLAVPLLGLWALGYAIFRGTVLRAACEASARRPSSCAGWPIRGLRRAP